jgi:REP element-mobilizing transposase RayT
LLPNHFHLIIRIKEDEFLPKKYVNSKSKISQPFSNLFNAYTKAINKKYNRTGSLFQKHPKRVLIKDEKYLVNLIIYVNTNPSHHNISAYDNYEHSSYKALISNKPTLIKREEVLYLFDDVINFKYVHQLKKVRMELIKEVLLE